MPKKSHSDIEVFKKAGEESLKKFNEEIILLGFTEVPHEEIIRFLLDKNTVKPKRATADNALQRQFRLTSNGYIIYIHTGVIGEDFASTGLSCIMLLRNGKKILFRSFRKNYLFVLLERILAYAKFFNCIAERTKSTQVLHEYKRTLEIRWKNKKGGGSELFETRLFLYGMTKQEKSFVENNEKAHVRNFLKTKGKVKARARKKRTTWKKKKKEKVLPKTKRTAK